MKKLLFFATLLLALASTVTVHAQTKWKSSNSTDTVTNTTSSYRYFSSPVKGNYCVQIDFKKISGTVGGTAYVEVSADHNTTPIQWAAAPSIGAITIPNADTSVAVVIPGNWLHYRVRTVPSGTQSHTMNVYHVLK